METPQPSPSVSGFGRPARFAPGSLSPVRYCARNRIRPRAHREGDHFHFSQQIFILFEGGARWRAGLPNQDAFVFFRIDASRE